ncbi:MAG TPA: hypothetical protein VIY73_13990, partial [Polyangiaceae bacterium]
SSPARRNLQCFCNVPTSPRPTAPASTPRALRLPMASLRVPRSMFALALVLAACGGSTTSPAAGDAGGPDARGDAPIPLGDDVSDAATLETSTDAPADDDADAAPYLACMDSTGTLSYSLKSCQSDSDCTIQQEETDCCGTILYAGVNQSSVSEFKVCESAWEAHFPGCGCASGQTKTEDGHVTHPGQDAGAPAVHCTDFTNNGGVCLTYTP